MSIQLFPLTNLSRKERFALLIINKAIRFSNFFLRIKMLTTKFKVRDLLTVLFSGMSLILGIGQCLLSGSALEAIWRFAYVAFGSEAEVSLKPNMPHDYVRFQVISRPSIIARLQICDRQLPANSGRLQAAEFFTLTLILSVLYHP